MSKKDIKNFTLRELESVLRTRGEAPYRARQIFSALYKKGIRDFNAIKTIPKPLRDKLEEGYYIGAFELSKRQKSSDGTEKFLFKLGDESYIESVLIKAKMRKTVCLSTQVGCKFRCLFCASGLRGFIRDLTPSEITGQILFLRETLEHKITNYVFMGMGEPLDNCENVFKAIMIMAEPEGMGIGARRITVSTCGIVPGIKKLASLGIKVNLSLSLHAADDKLRDEIMPVNKKYPIAKLIDSSREYIDKTGRMLTLEYILIKGKNDSLKDAKLLAKVAGKLKSKVNLIPASASPGMRIRPSERKVADIFMKKLLSEKVKVTLRESKGKDIRAACGQLAGFAPLGK